MKKPLLIIVFFLALASFANAQNYEGTWKGVMKQDSPVVRINFEMVLEEKDGKINGFLYRLFIVNDSLIYNTVRVVARVSGDMLIVEDDASVSRNFEEKANRKIKAAYFFKINPKQKNADTLSGEWTTSRFKNKYMSVSGSVKIVREPRYETTQLFKRLEEKQLHTTIAFVPRKTASDIAMNKPKVNSVTEIAETKVEPETVVVTTNNKKQDSISNAVVINKSQNKPTETIIKPPIVTEPEKQKENKSEQLVTVPVKKDSVQNVLVVNQPVKEGTELKNTPQPSTTTQSKPQIENKVAGKQKEPENTTSTNLAVNKKDSLQTSLAANQPIKQSAEIKNTNKPTAKDQPNSQTETKVAAKPQITNVAAPNTTVKNNNQQLPATSKPSPQQAVSPSTVIKQPEEKPSTVLIKTDEATIIEIPKEQKVTVAAPPVINNPIITKRATEIIQTLSVFEDSITLSLYDNGEIDGDTVSVFLNNEKIINNIGLKATAYKHTVYFKPGETVQLTLFAENLGTVPPNSGLLVVYSGEQRYQVFFTSTLNKSAVILLKRE